MSKQLSAFFEVYAECQGHYSHKQEDDSTKIVIASPVHGSWAILTLEGFGLPAFSQKS